MEYLEIEVLVYCIVHIGQVLPYSSDSISGTRDSARQYFTHKDSHLPVRHQECEIVDIAGNIQVRRERSKITTLTL